MPKPWQRLGLPKPKSEASRGALSLIDYEVYSGIELPDGPFVVRLDGWGFHALAKRLRLKKPFDRRFAKIMSETAGAFFLPFNPDIAYVFSDEINFLFTQPTSFRRIEKIDSVFAGLASATFSQAIAALRRGHHAAAFDCRAIPLLTARNIPKYFIWRQAECWRNHNNAWAQHVLISRAKLSPRAADRRLSGLKVPQLAALCKKYSINLNKTPAWQRNGIILYKTAYTKRGYDPIRKKSVRVLRHKAVTDWSPPLFKSAEGRKMLNRIMKGGEK